MLAILYKVKLLNINNKYKTERWVITKLCFYFGFTRKLFVAKRLQNT